MTVRMKTRMNDPAAMFVDRIEINGQLAVRIPDSRGAVETGRQNKASVRTKFRTANTVGVIEGGETFASRDDVPYVRLAIEAGRDQALTVRTERGVIHPCLMFQRLAPSFARLRVPDLGGIVPAGRRDEAAVGAEAGMDDQVEMWIQLQQEGP